ncbi:MAG: hypothetical protein ABIR96_02170 [Bdellovibrionota bacterium]
MSPKKISAHRSKLSFLFAALFAVTSFASFAADSEQGSVEWQRLKLERELEAKLRDSLSPVLLQNQYLVSVQIALSEVDASASKDAATPADASAAANSAAAMKSDLPLSKLGFWEPLLKDLENNGGAKSASAGSGWADVFGRISQVDVKVILDTKVPEAKKTLVSDIINRGVTGLSRVKPVVDVSSGDLSTPAREVARSTSDWILEFKNGISLLFAVFTGVLLFALLGFFIAKDFSSIFRKGIESVDGYINFQKENASKSGSNSDDVGGEEASVGTHAARGHIVQSVSPTMMAASSDGHQDPSKDGFHKFHELYEKAPEIARGLVKKWINARGANDAKALFVLGQRASVDDLNDLFGSLPLELKQTCRKLISSPFGADAFAEGLDYMRRQVMEQYVSARPSLPESTLAVIDSVTEKEFLEIAQGNAEMGAMLLSALPTAKVAGILNTMPTELFSTLSDKTGNIFEKNLASESSNIEATIRSVRERQVKRSAFLEKSAELIPSASPDKEVILYKMLIQAGDLDMVRDTALKSLPSSLVTQVPVDVVQRILTRMTGTDRAELIVSQPTERSTFLLNCLGQSGDKLRDLVDTEVQDVQGDTNRVEALREDAETLWSNLVLTLRQMQRQNPVFARSLKPIVNRWVKELAESGSKSGLSEAA